MLWLMESKLAILIVHDALGLDGFCQLHCLLAGFLVCPALFWNEVELQVFILPLAVMLEVKVKGMSAILQQTLP